MASDSHRRASQEAKHLDLEVNEDGDMLGASPFTVLVLSCNCIGRWGFGTATRFAARFPSVHKRYWQHCNPVLSDDKSAWIAGPDSHKLLGTALLIPPNDECEYWIACLFTSIYYKLEQRDPDEMILVNTAKAMMDMLQQICAIELRNLKGGPTGLGGVAEEVKLPTIGELVTNKISSIGFEVAWDKTEAVLKGLTLKQGMRKVLHVYTKKFDDEEVPKIDGLDPERHFYNKKVVQTPKGLN
ncbi:hypothetical protein EJ05DRAFT_476341 [Pseudovirgaria hyperparasitica]|uniref:ADP-ribose 1''-phosphate phosphatase n=1 Tax=Pseudovirgaria hyperparasitica TaxID=470096 RepID=A0A6A6W7S1_9PEZI|nr:uncharacterized protein EJ05DRAFT_476341 [Pseudovirgaria hyperparasitica]KAF2758074.1 hypothetical protein EJ05DRAFT_476341 [Pseudovirgaria hyperparasitica]